MKTLADMTQEIMDNNIIKGWEPDPSRTFGEECALMHSEISEAYETWRVIGFDERTRDGKPDDVASELADTFIRLLHYTAVHGFDLESEYERKMAFNRTRPFRHGNKRS